MHIQCFCFFKSSDSAFMAPQMSKKILRQCTTAVPEAATFEAVLKSQANPNISTVEQKSI